MPEQETSRRAERDLEKGKAPSTAAGEFVHVEIEHVREGKHGARSPQQAVAIGLSKARRAGVPLPSRRKGKRRKERGRGPNANMRRVNQERNILHLPSIARRMVIKLLLESVLIRVSQGTPYCAIDEEN